MSGEFPWEFPESFRGSVQILLEPESAKTQTGEFQLELPLEEPFIELGLESVETRPTEASFELLVDEPQTRLNVDSVEQSVSSADFSLELERQDSFFEARFPWEFPQRFDNGGKIQLGLESEKQQTVEASFGIRLWIPIPLGFLDVEVEPWEAEVSEADCKLITYNFEVYERLRFSLKTPYEADARVWHALLTAFASEFGEIQTARRHINDNTFVTTATGGSLDKIAELFDVERRTDETDEQTRLAIQTALRSQITSATTPELIEVISFLLDIDPEEIEIEESTGTTPRINIIIDPDIFEQRTAENFTREIQPLTAAGVLAVGLIPGTFRFTESEPGNEGIGFAELDETTNTVVEGTGGKWPSLLSG